MGFGKDGKGTIIREGLSQTLGTLDQQVGIIVGTKLATLERFRIIKTEVIASVTGLTTGEGTGLNLFLADGAFNAAEIEAAIEANGPLGPNETSVEEVADRYTKWFGTVDRETGTEAVFENSMGGHLMENTIRWTFSRTKSWVFFVYNLGNQLTTGSNILLRAKHFGVWVT